MHFCGSIEFLAHEFVRLLIIEIWQQWEGALERQCCLLFMDGRIDYQASSINMTAV